MALHNYPMFLNSIKELGAKVEFYTAAAKKISLPNLEHLWLTRLLLAYPPLLHIFLIRKRHLGY